MYNVVFSNNSDLFRSSDFGLVVSKREIEAPEIKTNMIDIIGANGYLDLTEALGGVKFGNRKIKLDFTFRPSVDINFITETYSYLLSSIHGKNFEIRFSDQGWYFYLGRVNIGSLEVERNIAKVSFECDCNPYIYSNDETSISRTFSDGFNFELSNDIMPVVPTIECDQRLSFQFNNNVYTHSAGTFQIPEIELKNGTNNIYVYADDSSISATCTFTYREGRL